MRFERKPWEGSGLARIAVAALLAEVVGCASTPPLKIGVGRIVPVSYLDEHAKAVGFAVDVVNEAARREGISVTWMPLVKGVAEDLRSGTIDLLSAGMATQERKEHFYVSEPWWFQEFTILTRVDTGQKIKRFGLQQVAVEFVRPYYDPATFVIDPPNTSQAAALESKAVCNGTLDGAVITHGELHDLFLNRPDECNGVRLQATDTPITYGLSIIARRSDERVAKRLRKRIDDLILDGTLLRFAAAHPPLPISGAVHLQDRVRERQRNKTWITAGCIGALLIVFLVWFLWDRQQDLTRTRRSEAEMRKLHDRLALKHEVARIGSYEWWVCENLVVWSPEWQSYTGFAAKPTSIPLTSGKRWFIPTICLRRWQQWRPPQKGDKQC